MWVLLPSAGELSHEVPGAIKLGTMKTGILKPDVIPIASLCVAKQLFSFLIILLLEDLLSSI